MGYSISAKGLLTIGFIFYAIIFIINLILHRKDINWAYIKRQIYKFVLFMYILFVIGITLFPINTNFRDNGGRIVINMNPLDILNYKFDYFSIINILGNILLLSPLPILLILNRHEQFKKLKYCLLLCFSISLIIEILQYLESYNSIVIVPRSTDILDVIFNTFGGVISYIIYKLYKCKNNNMV